MIAVAKTLDYYSTELITAVKSFIGQVPVVASGGSKGVDCFTYNSTIKGLNPDAGTRGLYYTTFYGCNLRIFVIS